MTKDQLNKLLNDACEIIVDMEDLYYEMNPQDVAMRAKITAFFNEIKEADADMEAQDWNTFKTNKI
jgi:hypothetical protein